MTADRPDEPVVDLATLEKLRHELNGEDAALRRFVLMYLELLPKRLAGVERAARRRDLTVLVDTLQNLDVTSRMLGAKRLSSSAHELFRGLNSAAYPNDDQLTALRQEAGRTAEVLERYLRDTPGRRSSR